MSDQVPIYTIGHSTRSCDEVKAMLRYCGVYTLMDVRSHPGSRHQPQWNREHAAAYFDGEGDIQYVWEPDLGGWTSRFADCTAGMAAVGVDIRPYLHQSFPKQRIAAQRKGPGWINQGLYDFSWFTAQPCFQEAVTYLVDLAHQGKKVAIMCAESLYWRCHRSMIADVIVATSDVGVVHIEGSARRVNRVLHREVLGDRIERYEPAIREEWRQHADS